MPSLLLSTLSLLPGDASGADGAEEDDIAEVMGFRKGAVNCSNNASERRWALDGACFSDAAVWDVKDDIGVEITELFVVWLSKIINETHCIDKGILQTEVV